MQMNSIWVIGGGRFGLKAAEKLWLKNPRAAITVVEKNKNVCSRLDGQSFKVVCTDGIDYLFEKLNESDGPDWIIPAIPIHVVFEWIRKKLSGNYHLNVLAVSEQVATALPNPFQGRNGELYISNADFICPEDCPEPAEICTYSGKPRPGILHKVLKAIRHDVFCSIVVQSCQLCPGVGGYSPGALFKALDQVVMANAPILLSTACRCHGVMHAFSLISIKKDILCLI